MPLVRSPYNYEPDVVSYNAGLECPPESHVQQHMRDECDINVLVARFSSGAAVLPPPPPPSDQDFTQVTDFMGAMNQIRRAQESFAALPSAVRAEFNNDPARMLERLQDESWAMTKGVELGLVIPRPAPAAPGQVQGSGDVVPDSPQA